MKSNFLKFFSNRVSVNRQGSVRFQNIILKPTQQCLFQFLGLLSNSSDFSLKEVQEFKDSSENLVWFVEALDYVVREKAKKEAASAAPTQVFKTAACGDAAMDFQKKYVFENCILCNTTTHNGGQELFFYDLKENRKYEKMGWKAFVATCSRKEEIELLHQSFCTTIKYTPFETPDIQPLLKGITTDLNTYSWPSWRNLEASPQVHPLISRFLDALFPKVDHKNYVLDWIFESLNRPSNQHLILIGKQGIGKSILIEDLCLRLHGEKNFEKFDSSTMEDKFNKVFDQRTLLFYDEARANTMKHHNRLKSWAADYISIEAKGIDQVTKPRTFSVVLTSNVLSNVRVDPFNSRKFAYPDMSDNELQSKMSPEEIKELKEGVLGRDQVLADFYCWLQKNTSPDALKFKNFVFKGHMFERMLDASTQPPIRKLLKVLKSKKQRSYTIDQINEVLEGKRFYSYSDEYLALTLEDLEYLQKVCTWKDKPIFEIKKGVVIPVNDFKLDMEVTDL